MRVTGHYSDGRLARAEPAVLNVAADGVSVLDPDGSTLQPATPLQRIEVSARLGRTPRHLGFPDGGRFTTDDNDAIDALTGAARRGQGLVDRLESRWRWVLAAVVLTVAAVVGSVVWGIPAAARHVAFQLPPAVGAQAERVAMEILDRGPLAPSTLATDEQLRLHRSFESFIQAHGAGLNIRVLFRDAAGSFGANALALPGGSVVFTDQLVALAEHDEELLAILAHEIGHIAERHALRRTVQASALSLATLLVFGDVSSVPALAASIPVILTEMGYSRDFEREADLFAVRTLQASGVDPRRLAQILSRLDPEQSGGSYLSTHPPTPERVELIHRHGAR